MTAHEVTDEELDQVLHLLRDVALDALDNAQACTDPVIQRTLLRRARHALGNAIQGLGSLRGDG